MTLTGSGEDYFDTSNLDRLRELSERLADTQNTLETFFDLAVDMFAVTRGSKYVRLNKAWTRTLGWELDEILQLPFIEMVHPDDQQRTMALYAGQHEGEAVHHFRNRLRHKDGTYRWVSWSATPVHNGQTFSVARDITEEMRYQAALEERSLLYRVMLEHVGDLVTVADLTGHIMFASKSYYTILGYDPAELVGKNLYDLVFSADHVRAQSATATAMLAEQPAFVDVRLMHKDGQLVSAKRLIAAIKNEFGEPQTLLLISRVQRVGE